MVDVDRKGAAGSRILRTVFRQGAKMGVACRAWFLSDVCWAWALTRYGQGIYNKKQDLFAGRKTTSV